MERDHIRAEADLIDRLHDQAAFGQRLIGLEPIVDAARQPFVRVIAQYHLTAWTRGFEIPREGDVILEEQAAAQVSFVGVFHFHRDIRHFEVVVGESCHTCTLTPYALGRLARRAASFSASSSAFANLIASGLTSARKISQRARRCSRSSSGWPASFWSNSTLRWCSVSRSS